MLRSRLAIAAQRLHDSCPSRLLTTVLHLKAGASLPSEDTADVGRLGIHPRDEKFFATSDFCSLPAAVVRRQEALYVRLV